jgi:ATP-dependent RNA helicase RhlE
MTPTNKTTGKTVQEHEVLSFDRFSLSPSINDAVRAAGYTTPTPIQAQAIPCLLQGKDMIGLAQTGTGKTAAFVLPLLQRLIAEGDKTRLKSVQALILAPTRELAEQINDVIKLFSAKSSIRSLTVYGGVSHHTQVAKLKGRGVQIVVACPGRLMDHIRGRTIDLSSVEYLVLDEADRMLDMGFIPDIKAIIAKLPSDRQTMLFSATMPDEIAVLTDSYLRDPTTVRIKAEQPVDLVTHSMISLKQEDKSGRLSTWLRDNPNSVAVVFTKMKHTAKRLGESLTKSGIASASLHGNLSQGQRQKALNGFKSGKVRALIATDIAARGIDVEGVTHVINYDMPDTVEAYIHRTGRAGRASQEGAAISFVTRGDRQIVVGVERWLKRPIERLEGDVEDTKQQSAKRGSSKKAAKDGDLNEDIGKMRGNDRSRSGRNHGRSGEAGRGRMGSENSRFKSPKRGVGERADLEDFFRQDRDTSAASEDALVGRQDEAEVSDVAAKRPANKRFRDSRGERSFRGRGERRSRGDQGPDTDDTEPFFGERKERSEYKRREGDAAGDRRGRDNRSPQIRQGGSRGTRNQTAGRAQGGFARDRRGRGGFRDRNVSGDRSELGESRVGRGRSDNPANRRDDRRSDRRRDDRGSGSTRDRFNKEAQGQRPNRGLKERSNFSSEGGRSRFGGRSRREGPGGGAGRGGRKEGGFRRGNSDAKNREFRGQQDIDPQAEYVYRERDPYYIYKGEDPFKPKRGAGRAPRGRGRFGGSKDGGRGNGRRGGRRGE